MTLSAAELLDRLAKSLRMEIGPAVEGDYARTQAFMAAVVAQTLGQQVALAPDHRRLVARDVALRCPLGHRRRGAITRLLPAPRSRQRAAARSLRPRRPVPRAAVSRTDDRAHTRPVLVRRPIRHPRSSVPGDG